MSYYRYTDFKNACENDRDNVIPINNVPENARNDFNLNTKSQLLDFIQCDGLENLTFVNTKDWENNPNKNKPIKVDAYEFTSMYKLGYIAFMHNDETNKWLIKSFHLSTNRNMAIYLAMGEAGLINKLEEEHE